VASRLVLGVAQCLFVGWDVVFNVLVLDEVGCPALSERWGKRGGSTVAEGLVDHRCCLIRNQKAHSMLFLITFQHAHRVYNE
jgi:hypothetical protein